MIEINGIEDRGIFDPGPEVVLVRGVRYVAQQGGGAGEGGRGSGAAAVEEGRRVRGGDGHPSG